MFMPLYPLAQEEMTNNTQEGCGAARQRQVRWGLSLWETLASSARRWGRISAYPTTSLTSSRSLLLLLLLLWHVHSVGVRRPAHARRHALAGEVDWLHHGRAREAGSGNGRGVTVGVHSWLKAVHLGVELALASKQLLVLHLLLAVHGLHVGHVHWSTAHAVLVEAVGVHAGGALQGDWVEAGSGGSVETAGLDLGAVPGGRTSGGGLTSAGSAAGGKTYFIHKTLVALLGLRLDADEDGADVLHNLGADLLIEEWGGEDLEDQGSAAVLVGQNLLQHLIVRREEQCLQNDVTRLRLVALVDDLQHGEVGNLVSAEVDDMRDQTRRQDSASPREGAGVEEPSQKQRAVGVGSKLDAVEGDGSSHGALLVLAREVALKASPHGTSSETTLGKIPETAKHDLKDEVVEMLVLEAALHDIVAELIKEQSHGVGSKRIHYHLLHGQRLGYVNDLLCSPSSVLVDTNLGQVRGNLSEHGLLGLLGAVLEQLLDYSVSEVVRRELGDLRKHVHGNRLNLLSRAGSIVDALADLTQSWGIVHAGVAGLFHRRDLIDIAVVLDGSLDLGHDPALIIVRRTQIFHDLDDVAADVGQFGSDQRGIGCSQVGGSCLSNTRSTSGTFSLSFGVRIRAGRGEDTVVAWGGSGAGDLSVSNADRSGSREDLFAIELRLGLHSAFEALEVDESAVLVSQDASRLNGTKCAEDDVEG